MTIREMLDRMKRGHSRDFQNGNYNRYCTVLRLCDDDPDGHLFRITDKHGYDDALTLDEAVARVEAAIIAETRADHSSKFKTEAPK